MSEKKPQSYMDEQWMERALELAERGRAWVAPNPMVGTVIVNDQGERVGEGWHRRFGQPHAEANALAEAGQAARGGTLYVNLEPCCHHGKTPPCTEAIIAAGVRRVVAALEDPNPKVAGQGFKQLRKAGIEVEVGTGADEAAELNSPYLKKAATGQAWVTLKIAQSLDGRIASVTGHSQWISGKESLAYAHTLRAMHDAVLVGARTVHADDPLLTVRHVEGRNPVRVVLDTTLSIDEKSKLLNTPDEAPTWLFCAETITRDPAWANRENLRIFRVSTEPGGRVSAAHALQVLSDQGIGSVMVEGGSRIWTTFLDHNLVDKIEVIIAPMIIGHGIDAINDLGILKVNDAIRLAPFRWRRVGQDLHVAARIVHGEE